MQRDALQLKEQIITIFKRRGPSLPIHISKETGLDLLFASAFLSELIEDKRLKVSVMKVGSSPLYLIPGQEHLLENFIEFLNKKEREAFLILKEKKFLKDSEQEPAIRVALRAIRDFAFEYRKNEELYWKFLRADESEFVQPKEKEEIVEVVLESEIKEIEKTETPKIEIVNVEEIKKPVKNIKKSAPRKKQDDKFFNRVKEFIDGKNAEIVEDTHNNHNISLGSHVKVQSEGEEKQFHIVGEYEADPATDKLSMTSPIGKALLGKKTGEIVEVEVPAGKTKYKILEIN